MAGIGKFVRGTANYTAVYCRVSGFVPIGFGKRHVRKKCKCSTRSWRASDPMAGLKERAVTNSFLNSNPCCPGVTRRSFLADTGMGFTGLALGAMLFRDGIVRAESVANAKPDGKP